MRRIVIGILVVFIATMTMNLSLALPAVAEDRLPAAVPYGWPNAVAEFQRRPTGLPGGTLAVPWRATNPDSFDCNGFGITDGPVPTCGAGVLADGRAAIAFEQWVKVGDGGAMGSEGVEPRLFVRAWNGKGWTPVGQGISLSPTGKPLSFSGAELRWPVDPTAGKALPYWHGSCRVLWGRREFWFGGFFTATDLRIGAVDDGNRDQGQAGRVDQLTMLWGANPNDRSEHAMGLRMWRMKAGRWVETKTVPMKHDATGEKTTGDIKTRTFQETFMMDVDPAGHVYLCTARGITKETTNTVTRAYPVKIVRYAGAGDEPPALWALDPLALEGSPFVSSQKGYGEPYGYMVLWTRGAFPLLGIQYRGIREKQVWRYWKLAANKWTLLWNGNDQDSASEFGRPVGQRPDGYPVWWFRKGGQPNNDFSGHPYYAEWQAGTEAGGGKFVEEKLPSFAPGSFSDVYPGQTVTWHNGQPLLAVTGVSRYLADATRTRQRLHAALWMRRAGQWVNAIGAAPAFTRQFHGGHDGILFAQAVVSAPSEAILLWKNDLPIHGPSGTYAATITLPQQ